MMGSVIGPNNAGYDSAKFSSNWFASCGYCSAKKMQNNGPARRGNPILHDGLSNWSE